MSVLSNRVELDVHAIAAWECGKQLTLHDKPDVFYMFMLLLLILVLPACRRTGSSEHASVVPS